MQNRWSEIEAAQFSERYGPEWGEDVALGAYCGSLLSDENEFTLPGAANLSVKGFRQNIFGESAPAMWIVEAGGEPPPRPIAVDLPYVRRLRDLKSLSDRELIGELRTHLLQSVTATPPPETPAHAFLPAKYVLHSQSGAVLALTDREEGSQITREAFGDSVILLPSCGSAFEAAKTAAEACEGRPDPRAVIQANHGILTWGETARAAYCSLVDIVNRAEAWLAPHSPAVTYVLPTAREVEERIKKAAPVVRGLLARRMTEPDRVFGRVILRPLGTPEVNSLLAGESGKKLAMMPPLAYSNAAITKAYPMWIDSPAYDDVARLRGQVSDAVDEFARSYEAYYCRHSPSRGGEISLDSSPRVVLLPGLGALCAGWDVAGSGMVREAVAATLVPRGPVWLATGWQAPAESELFRQEHGAFHRARTDPAPLAGRVALVTGAAGAIGAGISEGLLQRGCAVALADLPGETLGAVFREFRGKYSDLAMELPFDVTEPSEVADAFGRVILNWGGLDLIVANAGIAHVSSLAEMKIEAFRRLERVNVEGVLNILSESARHFALQASGGDVVLISTKNVFAPGARFGAYSATKAAAHQLGKIASLELAELGVRVNMVAPDAVFRHGARPSGLWAEVGADRARSRGMTADQLEAYYRNRCLLKAEVTAEHVANAVIFFATHQTPTTGATLPVDGGLPEATPR